MNDIDPRYVKDKYVGVDWDNVQINDKVWLSGTHLNEFRVYGPHWVVDPMRRCLRNINDEKFLNFQNNLVKEV